MCSRPKRGPPEALRPGAVDLRLVLMRRGSVPAPPVDRLHSVSQPGAHGIFQDEPRFQYWYPALVTGLKIAVVKDSHANLNFGFAWGKASRGFYIELQRVVLSVTRGCGACATTWRRISPAHVHRHEPLPRGP